MNRPIKGNTGNLIVKINKFDLVPGGLFKLFDNGAIAVVLENDDRVPFLWKNLFGSKNGTGPDSGEILPWEGNLMDIAKNYQSRGGPGDDIGDVMFFIKDRLAYIARKFDLFEKPDPKKLETDPRNFINEGQPFTIPEDILRTIWDVGAEVFKSALPKETIPFPYAMSVERLKYNDSPADFDKLVMLLNNSSDRWAQFGRKMDHNIINAAGPFQYSYIKVLYGILCEIPAAKKIFRKLNEIFRPKNVMTCINENADMIGRPHTDGRLITCLSSVRSSIKTEIFDGNKWIDLPLTGDSLAIFPGRGLESYGIHPTWHRILHLKKVNDKPGQSKSNETSILGLRSIDRISK